MKNLLLVMLLVCASNAYSQSITNYSFNASPGTFTALSSPTNPALTAGNADDGYFNNIPIGFDFWYMGTRYTTVSASTNGWITLGANITNDELNNNLTSGGSPRPVIAPLWDDISLQVATNLSYKTTGSAGSRVFTLQYLSVRWDYSATEAEIDFQVNLYETTGKVEFVYRRQGNPTLTSPSASIGITATATGSGNFLSLNGTGTTPTASSTTETTTLNSKPTSGQIYAFTPPVPAAPGSLTFSNVGSTSMTLNWTDNSSNERGFVIYRSTDGTNYSFYTQVAANTTSSTATGLTGNTTYYWRVYAVTEGGLSSALSGTQATTCQGPDISQLPTSNLISYYRFSGNAIDDRGNNNGTFQGGTPTLTTDRFGNANSAYTFNGTSHYVSTTNSYVNPSPISVSIWFKTTTTVGGVMIGFSTQQTGNGGNRDRFIYMTSTGTLYFGVAPSATKYWVNSSAGYNDGNWHLVTGTVGAGGLKLYVDGALVASDPSTTSCESYTGYWRIGHNDIATWPNAPSSYFFDGSLDDAVVYHRELTSSEVSTLYNSPDGAGSNAPVCVSASLNLTSTSVFGATYSWTGPNSFSSSQQNPTITYSAAYAGVYTVQVTTGGCGTPSTAYVKVASSTTTGQWTGNASTEWANADNWCNGIAPTSTTDVTIPAGATRMPSISNSINCRNLTINSGATLTLNSAGTLNIAGTLSNSGTFTNNGTVNFNGTSGQQTFSGVTSFYNLTLSNTSGLLLPATITVNNDLTISAGTLNVNNYDVTISGNMINNGGFTAGTGRVTFGGTGTHTISGSSTTAFNNITVNKGSNFTSHIIDVQSAITMASGGLTLTNGTFKLSSSSTITPFTADIATSPYLIPSTAGLWVNGGTVSITTTASFTGLVRVSNGVLNVGDAADENLRPGSGATITIEGGTVNVAGRLTYVNNTDAFTYTMTGGSFIAPVVGSTHTVIAPFHINVAGTSFNMSGGTIIIRQAGGSNVGFKNFATSGSGFTGGVLQIGDGSTPASQTILIQSTNPVYNLTVNSANATAQLSTSSLTVNNNVTLTAGTLNTNSLNLTVNGNLTNTSSGILLNSATLAIKGNITNNQASMSAGSGTLQLDGSSTQTISGSQPFKTFNLVTSNAAGITLNNNLSISGTHTFSAGVITTSATPNYLIYEAGSSYTGSADSRHVNGWVKKIGSTDFTFPVGNGTYERPVNINTLSGASEFNVKHDVNTPDRYSVQGPLVSINPEEYWLISKVSGGSASVTMNWNHSKIPFPNYTMADISAASYNGSEWVNAGGTASGSTTATGSITSNAVSSFSRFAIGSKGYPIPVKLVSFTARRMNGNTRLEWITENEKNVSHFDVQRSNDGVNFYNIQTTAARNSDRQEIYTATDNTPVQRIAWYRLVSVDIDGKLAYSKVVAVSDANPSGDLKLMINPVQANVLLSAGNNVTGVFEYRISTLNGQMMQKGKLEIRNTGLYTIALSSNITTGTYILEVVNADMRFSYKMTVK